MTRKKATVPTYRGRPIQALLSVGKGEKIAGTWTTPTIPGIGFYKLLAKRCVDGTCEWVHFVQRPNGDKDKVYRGTVENEGRLADVLSALNSALRTAYGPLIQLRPADADISFVDGVITGRPPDKVQ